MQIGDRVPDIDAPVSRLIRVVQSSRETAAAHRRDVPPWGCRDRVDLTPCRQLVAALEREISLLRRGLADAIPPALAPRQVEEPPCRTTPGEAAGESCLPDVKAYAPAPLGQVSRDEEPPPPPPIVVHLDARLVTTNLGTLLDLLA